MFCFVLLCRINLHSMVVILHSHGDDKNRKRAWSMRDVTEIYFQHKNIDSKKNLYVIYVNFSLCLDLFLNDDSSLY